MKNLNEYCGFQHYMGECINNWLHSNPLKKDELLSHIGSLIVSIIAHDEKNKNNACHNARQFAIALVVSMEEHYRIPDPERIN